MTTPLRALLVDGDASRRHARAAALRTRGLEVHEADDAVGALRELKRLDPDVFVLALDSAAMDLETLARGVLSMRALEHLQLLAIGDAPPLSDAAEVLVTVVPATLETEALAKEAERLAAKSKRKR